MIATFAGEDDQKFSQAVKELSPRVFLSLREFFGCVYRDGATFRLVEGNHDRGYGAVSLSAVIMAWKRNIFVLSNPFLLQWTLTQFSVMVALALLACVRIGGNLFLAASAAAAVIATYSSGNSMVLWPIMIAGGFLLKLQRKQVAALTIVGLLTAGLYLTGYDLPDRLQLSNFVLHPIYSLEFIGAYMSMPFGGIKAPRFGQDSAPRVSSCVASIVLPAQQSRIPA